MEVAFVCDIDKVNLRRYWVVIECAKVSGKGRLMKLVFSRKEKW